MYLKILAPFRSHFVLNPGVLSAVTDDYTKFWQTVQKSYKSKSKLIKDIQFLHSDMKKDKVSYSKTEDDTLSQSLNVMRVIPGEVEELVKNSLSVAVSRLNDEEKTFGKKIDFDLESAQIEIYDNTISTIEYTLKITDINPLMNDENYRLVLDTLESVTVDFTRTFVDEFYDKTLKEFLKTLSTKYDSETKFIQQPGSYEAFKDLKKYDDEEATRVLWVTRTIGFDQDDKMKNEIINYWLRGIGSHSELEKVKNDSTEFSLLWVNYIVREDADDIQKFEEKHSHDKLTFSEAWDSMKIAQYYYSALDSLNKNLHDVIAFSYTKAANKRIRNLNIFLNNTSSATRLLIIHFREIQKYLKRNKLSYLQKIMEKWDFENLIEYAEDKMNLCKERVEQLHNVSMQRSSLYTDILLLVIGAISIFDLFLGLSQYGRTLTGDAIMGFREDNAFNFLAVVATESTDNLLIYSLIVIVLISIFYYYFRRKSIL